MVSYCFKLKMFSFHRLDKTNVEIVFDYCFDIFNDDTKYPNIFRRGVIERICVPCLQHLSIFQLKVFYKKNIKMLTNHIEERFNKFLVECLEIQIINKICCFKIISIMFEFLGKSEISSPSSEIALAYSPQSTTGKELTSFLSRYVHYEVIQIHVYILLSKISMLIGNVHYRNWTFQIIN